MSRGIKKWTEEIIIRFQNEGRGKGKLATYTPWIKITDLYSQGQTAYPYSYLTERNHELLSLGEHKTFVMLEWRMDNIDIREQFPLDRDITLEIACELGVPHPYYPTTHVPCVMTLDFLVTRIIDGKEAYFAYSVKTQKDLNDPKVVERMEIERTFCAMAGMTYFLIISDRIPHNKVKNLFWIRQAQIDPEESDSLRMFFEEHQMRMTNDLTHTQFQGSLVDYCTKYDQRCSVSAGTGLRVARMLLANRTMSMDLTNATPERAPLSTFRVTALPGRLRSMGGA